MVKTQHEVSSQSTFRRLSDTSQVISRGHDNEAIVIELKIAMTIEAFKSDRTVTYRVEIVERDRKVIRSLMHRTLTHRLIR